MTIPEQAVEAAATEIELVFKPLVMGQCISDWSMKQLVDASREAAQRAAARLLVGVQRPEDVARAETQRFCDAMNGRDIDDFDKRAEHFMVQMLDGLTVSSANRNSVKAALAANFAALALPHAGRPQEGDGEPWEYWRARAITAEVTLRALSAAPVSPQRAEQSSNNHLRDQLMTIHDQLRTGMFGQREVWERSLREAVAALSAAPQAGCAKEGWRKLSREDWARIVCEWDEANKGQCRCAKNGNAIEYYCSGCVGVADTVIATLSASASASASASPPPAIKSPKASVAPW